MAQRIKEAFARANNEGRPAHIIYLTAGYPNLETTTEVLLSLQRSGVDVIELGIPFSDPLADGPTIQKAHIWSVENKVDITKCLEIVGHARAAGLTVPVVFMGYYNSILQHGERKLVEECSKVGVDGFIVVDLPPEESVYFRGMCSQFGLSYIPLITPATSDARITSLSSIADSFIYVVSHLGVTGAQDQVNNELNGLLSRIRKRTQCFLAVGFGVSNHTQFKSIGNMADGVVIGSKFISVLGAAEQGKEAEAAFNFCHELSGRACGDYKRDTPLVAEENQAASAAGAGNMQNGVAHEQWFGEFGGQYIPEAIFGAIEQLQAAYEECKNDPAFWEEFRSYYTYTGRPSGLHYSEGLTKHSGGAKIYLKREDLNHTGAHKINNALGQALLTKRLGKTRIIAETGAGQHGVATATICAKFGFECTIYMGAEDCRRQALNVFKMKLLGATVVPVHTGSKTLKDAVNEAMRDWVTNVHTTHYLVGSAIGPHPFPTLVRDFQRVIGDETKKQMLALTGKLPDAVVACVGGGSNAIGMFYPFVEDSSVRLIGVEAAGDGVNTEKHSATLSTGTVGVFQGTKTFLLQNAKGEIMETHSISAGLDYPGVGPEHSYLKSINRAEYYPVSDSQALSGFRTMCQCEGIIPALESSHAIYYALELAKTMSPDQSLVICVSGRGDKDVNSVAESLPKLGPIIDWDLRFESDPTK